MRRVPEGDRHRFQGLRSAHTDRQTDALHQLSSRFRTKFPTRDVWALNLIDIFVTNCCLCLLFFLEPIVLFLYFLFSLSTRHTALVKKWAKRPPTSRNT
jgi:hypothetical protein